MARSPLSYPPRAGSRIFAPKNPLRQKSGPSPDKIRDIKPRPEPSVCKYEPRHPRSSDLSDKSLHETRPVLSCPYCGSARHITRKGFRENKFGPVQLFYCRHCQKKFTPLVTKHKTFPLRIIIDSLTLYNTLYTIQEAADLVSKKYGIVVSRQNVKNWLTGFAEYLPFLRLRPAIGRQYERRHLLVESQLFHGQVYAFKYHRAKMEQILKSKSRAESTLLHPLHDFLLHVPRDCPHQLFRQERGRASTHKNLFNIDEVVITPKTNTAVRTARFVLQAVATNKLRHEKLQEFMIANDSVTIAVEVPITLTQEDVRHFQQALGFQVPFTLPDGGVITGHIDILQIRNGMIHILDYKPGAKKVKPIEQLTLYALALSRRTGLRLYHFKCAWFDDEHFFEFYPLHVVYKKNQGLSLRRQRIVS